MLSACSGGDETVVSLNVSSTSVGPVSTLRIEIDQSGQTTWATSIIPPTEDIVKCPESEGDDTVITVIKSSFFNRLTLEDWSSGTAIITVHALDESGDEIVSGDTEVEIEKGEAVVAHVELAGDFAPDCPVQGTAGAGAGGAAAQAGASGAPSQAGAGGAPSQAGAGGTAAEGPTAAAGQTGNGGSGGVGG